LASTTADALPAGQQVYISYGDRSNDQLLQYYGFVEVDNPHDVYIMPPLREWNIDAMEQACGRKIAAGRLEKLDRAGLLGGSRAAAATAATTSSSSVMEDTAAANAAGGVVVSRAFAASSGGIDEAVVQALRALISTDAEWTAAGEAIGNFASPVSDENERCARRAAQTALELELAAKPTTLAQDQELLQRMKSMPKAVDAMREDLLALRFRIEKKKLLQETIDKLKL